MTKLDVINNALLKAGLPLAAIQGDEDWNALFVFDKVVGEIMRGYALGLCPKICRPECGRRRAGAWLQIFL